MSAAQVDIAESGSASAQETRAQSVVLPGQTPAGEYILSVLVKRTYDVAPGRPCPRAGADKKLVSGDIHYQDPMNSSVRFESDFVPYKVATDVVVNGTAYTPSGRPETSVSAVVRVGNHHKEVRVVGDRRAHYRPPSGDAGGEPGPPIFSDPEPFTSMELLYERAYGGIDISSNLEVSCPYPRNHLGRGFVVANEKRSVDELLLPNLEDPEHPLTPENLCAGECSEWESQPMPQGFGWYAKYWLPRASLAGVLPADRAVEAELREAFSAAVPPEQRELYEQTGLKDMDFRFFNGASPGLAVPFLAGDEPVQLIHLSREGELSFQLPGEVPRIGLDIGSGVEEPEVVLHTVMIRPEDRQLDLVWRAAVSYPGPDWLPEMKKMEVSIE